MIDAKRVNEYARNAMAPSRRIPRSISTERKTDVLNQFRNFNADQMQVEDLVALLAFGEQYKAAFSRFAEVPEWVEVQLKSLAREIKTKFAESNEAELRKAKAALTGLQTTEEKRESLRKRIADLESKLATA